MLAETVVCLDGQSAFWAGQWVACGLFCLRWRLLDRCGFAEMFARIAEQVPELRVFRKQRAGQRLKQRDDGFILAAQRMDLRSQNPQPEVFLRSGQGHGLFVGAKRFVTVGKSMQDDSVIDAG